MADIVIRYAKYALGTTHTFYSHHAIIEKQALEHVRVGELVGWEGTLHSAVSESLLSNLQEHPLAVALNLVETHNAVELGVVGLGVGVNHVSWWLTFIYVIAEVV